MRRTARIAGGWYLLMGIGTAFGMGYVDPLLRGSNDAALTASTLRSLEGLFLAGIAATSLGMIAMLFLASTLCRLFESVDKGLSRLLLIFVVVGVAITMLKMVNLLVALQLSQGVGELFMIDTAQRNGLIMTLLAAYRCGGQIAGIFWGLWLLPFGLLILKSGFAPRLLGILMTLGCCAYLWHSIARLFFPNYGEIAAHSLIVPTLGEVGTIVWFLVKGVGDRRVRAS